MTIVDRDRVTHTLKCVSYAKVRITVFSRLIYGTNLHCLDVAKHKMLNYQ